MRCSGCAMNRVLLHKDEVSADAVALLRGRRARHILEVLRAETGKTIRIGIINGPKGTGDVVDATADRVTLSCRFESKTPATPPISLLLALPRPKVLKRLYPQLAAMSLEAVYLTNGAKVDRNYFDTHWLQPDNYDPLLIEGLEQAGETLVPRIEVVKRLKPFIEDAVPSLFAEHTRLIAHPGKRTDWRGMEMSAGRKILLAVGPEGGWTDPELKMFDKAGFSQVSLGNRTLRTDTACVALLAAIQCFLTPDVQ